jgi:hypothetical protein|tara:strand:+ start:516 stop:638 length:123 start_codon:yes stop_codon:yes gene_type:complete
MIGTPRYKLFIDDDFLVSPNSLNAMMQLPDLLNPGRKARH